jgi:phosphoglucosamine mutase
MITEEVCDQKTTLATPPEPVKCYPQYLKNVAVKDKAAVLADDAVWQAVKQAEDKIGGKGRVLLRQSGTEPLIRVMVECEKYDDCVSYAQDIVAVIVERGHSIG